MTAIPTLKQVEQHFEQEWARQHRVYGSMLSTKTLTLIKQLAKNVYLQGRIDAMCDMTEAQLARQLAKGDK